MYTTNGTNNHNTPFNKKTGRQQFQFFLTNLMIGLYSNLSYTL